jgi:hypothetical protein
MTKNEQSTQHGPTTKKQKQEKLKLENLQNRNLQKLKSAALAAEGSTAGYLNPSFPWAPCLPGLKILKESAVRNLNPK